MPIGAIFIGNSAGSTGSTGATGSICIGTNSGDRYQSSGSVSIGPGSSMNGQGPATISIGYNAGASGTTGATNNTLIGYNSGSNLGPGQYNVMIGSQAGPSNGTGCTGNVFIGYYSGTGITSGSNNVFIGNFASANLISYTSTGTTGSTGATSNNLSIGSDQSRLNVISIGPYNIMRFPLMTQFTSGAARRIIRMILPPGTGGACLVTVSAFVTSVTPNTGVSTSVVTLSGHNVGGTVRSAVSSATASSTITTNGTLTLAYSAGTIAGVAAILNITLTAGGGGGGFGVFATSRVQVMVQNVSCSDIQILQY
jgi:hypothetical protein